MQTWFVRTGSVSALVVLVGCGGGYSAPPPAGPTPPPANAATTVAIVGDRGAQSFNPNPATVVQGRTVAWQNSDSVTHRIVSNDGLLDTGNIAPGAASGATPLTTDGTNYHCSIHPGMVGAINGAGGTPPPCTGIYC